MSDASGGAGPRRVAVIGAGIVGACTAYELRKAGLDVVLVDRDEPGAGASFGNSGALSPSSIAPLAMPGVLASVPRMLVDPRGPLYLPPSYLHHAFPWLARFVAAARPQRVREIAQAMGALHLGAVENHLALAAEIGAPELIVRHGHLHLYPDRSAWRDDASAWELRAQHGFAFEELDRQGIVALEPHIGARYTLGVYLKDHATVLNPLRYLLRVVQAFRERGGDYLRDRIVRLQPQAGRWRCQGQAQTLEVDQVVLAAGAWSLELLAGLGIHVPLETQRGYHVRFPGHQGLISRTVVLCDRKVFMAPMEDGLRVGGTVEFGGTRREPDYRRADLLAEFARETFGALAGADYQRWMGHRPCMPDTLPRIGPVAEHPGLWLAFGHGHLGLTDSANTGRALAALMRG